MKRFLAASLLVAGLPASLLSGDKSRWVNPLIGTSATGHTFPAASVPFGLVQAGPDTGNGSWHYCSGYRYEDKTVCGFTQTHLNGTGCPDFGDWRILPLTDSTRSTCSTRFNIDPLKNFPQRATSRRLSCHGIMCGVGG